MNDKKRILIVDDHPIVRLGLTDLINNEKDLVVCGEAENAHKGLKAISAIQPDLVIVDVSLNKGPSGIELIKNIRLRYPKLPILVLSIHDESVYSELVLRAGAKGYIMKQEANDVVLEAIHRILNGEIYVSDTMKAKLLNKFIHNKSASCGSPLDQLSDRELEVFRMIGQGFGTRQIAQKLNLSIKTIETYRAHLKDKLKLRNSAELVQYSIRWTQSEMFG